jgi:hypothetical protein
MRPLHASVRGRQGSLDMAPDHHVERIDRVRRDGLRIELSLARTCALAKSGDDLECSTLTDENGAIHHGRHFTHIARPSILGEHTGIFV